MKNQNIQSSTNSKKKNAPQTNASFHKSDQEVVESLRLVLADTFVLYMKTYAVHWNYQGPKFFSVHKLTEEHYQQLAEAIDVIAERIRAIGEVAPISLETILASSDLDEMRKGNAEGDETLIDLIEGHTLLAQRAHEAADICEKSRDIFSQDMMIQRIGEHEKAAWMLRSFLQRGASPSQPNRTHS